MVFVCISWNCLLVYLVELFRYKCASDLVVWQILFTKHGTLLVYVP